MVDSVCVMLCNELFNITPMVVFLSPSLNVCSLYFLEVLWEFFVISAGYNELPELR